MLIMNQRIIAAFVSCGGTTWQSVFMTGKERECQNRVGGRRRKIGPYAISSEKTSSKYVVNRKRKLRWSDADGFASSLPTNRHDSPRPPAVSNYYKVIRTSWGGMVLAWGRGTYQYLWWWWPDLQERHIRGVSQLRKWPLSEIKVTFWWQKWSVGQYRFPQTVPPIYVAGSWGKLVHFNPILNSEAQSQWSQGKNSTWTCRVSKSAYWRHQDNDTECLPWIT